MTVVSTAPAHVVRRYLRGKCFVLAIELHRKTGLPLWGLRMGQGGEIDHAFVADPDQDLAIDIRGAMSISRVGDGANHDCVAEPVTEDEIMDQVFSFEPSDVREARRAVADHLHGLPRKKRARRVEGRSLEDSGPPL